MKVRSVVVVAVVLLLSLFLMPAVDTQAAGPGLILSVTGATEDGRTFEGQMAVLRLYGRDDESLVARVHLKGTLSDAAGDSTLVKGTFYWQVEHLDTHEFCHTMTVRMGATEATLSGQTVQLDRFQFQIFEDAEGGIDGNNLCIMAERFDDSWFEDLARRFNIVLRALAGKA